MFLSQCFVVPSNTHFANVAYLLPTLSFLTLILGVRFLAADMATSEIEKKFKKAAYLIRNGPPNKNTSSDIKLKYYSYYKQATEGDVKGSQVRPKLPTAITLIKSTLLLVYY